MVRRAKDPEDHRRSVIELTEQGRELIGRVCPENDRMFTERFGVWSKEEKRELLRLIAKYHKSFQMRKDDKYA